ncbi:MAG: radical SAM family heme chaperone HemW [Hyphomicrobiaceae bacterium]
MAPALTLHPNFDTGGASTAGTTNAGFGVYVHWPFCASKCPYCDFNSHVRHGGIDEARFRAAYIAEVDATADRIGPRRTGSVFFGGGTPSLMQPETVAAILQRIDLRWPLLDTAEVTLEANPSSVEARRFAGYRAAGVNRVSLGVQSLADPVLRTLGRLHTADEAREALDIARRTFERFSFDLIYARPGQSPADWRHELGEALKLAEGHLSLYQLTIENGTPFAALHASGRLQVPGDDEAAGLYALTGEMTSAAGLSAYEVSNYARPGQESRHNLLYWRYGEYAGIGAGAHGRLLVGSKRYATTTERSPEHWLARMERDRSALVEDIELTPAEQTDEALLMGLRLAEGIDFGRITRLTGTQPAPAVLAQLIDLGLIEQLSPQRVRASPAGRMVLNEVVLRLSTALQTDDERHGAL